jgi:hypothetical protein
MTVAFSTQSAHPSCRTLLQFGVILVLPHLFFAIQKTQQLLAAKFIPGSSNQERATPAWPDQTIDFFDQVLRQNDMCTSASHINSVTYKCAYVKPIIPQSQKKTGAGRLSLRK